MIINPITLKLAITIKIIKRRLRFHIAIWKVAVFGYAEFGVVLVLWLVMHLHLIAHPALRFIRMLLFIMSMSFAILIHKILLR